MCQANAVIVAIGGREVTEVAGCAEVDMARLSHVHCDHAAAGISEPPLSVSPLVVEQG